MIALPGLETALTFQPIEHLQRGDIRGLEALVRLHQVRAIRTAYLVTRKRQLAQDIVQAAFLRAYERIGQLDPHRPLGPWFLTSVLHDAIKATASGAPLELLVENAEFIRAHRLDYRGGERYPWLERIPGRADVLSELIHARRR